MYRVILPVILMAGAATAAAPVEPPMAPMSAKDAAGLERDLAGLTPGKPQECIRHLDARSSRLYGSTVLFKVSSGLVYRNNTRGGCTNSGMQTALQTETSGSQLCAGQPARAFDPVAGVLTGTCTLGAFVPYRK